MAKTADTPKAAVIWAEHAMLKMRTLDQQSAEKLKRKASQLADPDTWSSTVHKLEGEEDMYVARLGDFQVFFKREDENVVILNVYSVN